MFRIKKTSTDKEKSKVPSKYGAVRTEGFRSKIESTIAKYLDSINLGYCYECESITLVPKFEYNGKKYRELKYTPDFIIYINDNKYYVEIKGYETPEFKLKWKLLHYHLSSNPSDGEFVIIKSLKEFKGFIQGTDNKVE